MGEDLWDCSLCPVFAHYVVDFADGTGFSANFVVPLTDWTGFSAHLMSLPGMGSHFFKLERR